MNGFIRNLGNYANADCVIIYVKQNTEVSSLWKHRHNTDYDEEIIKIFFC